jgi:RNA polymerase sigma factor (sigma-70 family)
MKDFTDEQIQKGILRNDRLVLQFIYKQFFYKVTAFVRSNNGDDDDARDVFQEAVIIIYRKLKEDKNALENRPFQLYLFSVCRFLWLKQLEKRKAESDKITNSIPYMEDLYDEDFFDLVHKNERYSLYQKHFRTLSSDCQKIMQLFFDKVPLKQIAQVMGYKSEKYAKKRKYKCKELLIERIKQDAHYKKILDDDT